MGSRLRVATAASWLAILGSGVAAGPVRAQGAGAVPPAAVLQPPPDTQVDVFDQLFDGFATAGGVGLRVLFSTRTSTNLCIDYAWGRQGAKGFYLGLQEAFWPRSALRLVKLAPADAG